MDAISYSCVRANLAKTLQRVCSERTPVIVTRRHQPSVVMVALEEFEAMEEAAHLLRSPANSWRLLRSIQKLESGKGRIHRLRMNH